MSDTPTETHFWPLPDYLNDLNACHEMEEVLTPKQWLSYWSFIEQALPEDGSVSILHATAAQRCEAFCRTLFPKRFKS